MEASTSIIKAYVWRVEVAHKAVKNARHEVKCRIFNLQEIENATGLTSPHDQLCAELVFLLSTL